MMILKINCRIIIRGGLIMEMRQVLFSTMKEIMDKNNNVIFMDADLAEANGTMELRKIYKDRAFDVGISEANMASMAAWYECLWYESIYMYIYTVCVKKDM